MRHEAVLRAVATRVVAHRRAVLAGVLLLSALLGSSIPGLRIEVDPDRNLPQDHPYIQALHEMHRVFGDYNLVVIGLTPKEGSPFTPHFLAKVAEITERLERIPGSVGPLLQSVASRSIRDVRATPEGIAPVPLMERPPETQAEADAVRERLLRNPDFAAALLSRDGRSLAIYATIDLTPELPAAGDAYGAVKDALRAADDGSFTWALSGPLVMPAEVGEHAATMVYYFPLALLVIAAIHYHAFGTLQAIFLPMLTALLAVVWAVGLMGLLGVPLDAFNTTTPILILAVAAGHAVQILKRYYEEYQRLHDSHAAVVESLAKVGGVMLAAGTIAALSFLSLASFGMASIRTFGVFTALGIVSTMLIELTIIPAVRAMLPPPAAAETARERRSLRWLDGALARLARVVSRATPGRLGAVLAVLLVGCGLLASRVQIDMSFKRQFAPGSRVRQQDDALNRSFAGTNTLIFLVEGPGENALADPEALRAIDRFERRMEQLPSIGTSLSYVDTLRKLHRAFHPESAGDALPESRELATQYLFLFSLSAGPELATQISTDNRLAKVVFLTQDDSTRYGRELIARAKEILAEELPPGFTYRISGNLASNGALTEVMVRGKLINVAQIAVLTVAVASLLLKSLLAGLLVAIPLAIAVAINFALMGALGIPLDVGTSAVAAMAVGMGADYAVYFLFRLREEYRASGDLEAATAATLATAGKAILFVSTAIAGGYATLCLSGFSLLVQLGGLVGLAMLSSSASSLTLLPAMTAVIARTRFRATLLGTPRAGEGHLDPSWTGA